jgi:hypothetical protein
MNVSGDACPRCLRHIAQETVRHLSPLPATKDGGAVWLLPFFISLRRAKLPPNHTETHRRGCASFGVFRCYQQSQIGAHLVERACIGRWDALSFARRCTGTRVPTPAKSVYNGFEVISMASTVTKKRAKSTRASRERMPKHAPLDAAQMKELMKQAVRSPRGSPCG